MKLKIAVLYGGTSKEREVSLSSGKGVISALQSLGHEVTAIDFNPLQLIDTIRKLQTCQLVFIALHGKQGEDGTVQGILDLLEIPYVGSGVLASSLAMDKSKAKMIFEQNDIPVAKGKTYSINELIEDIVVNIQNEFTIPLVVKPNQEGSTLGLTIVKEQNQLKDAVQLALQHDSEILVEQFIEGRELTVAVLGNRGDEKALPIIEIIPKGEYYDYESKYAVGGSEHIVPAHLNEDTTRTIQEYAVQAHQALGCETYSRVDFILTKDNNPIILEVNTLPGMTPTSLYPDAAKSVDMSYEKMISQFIELTLNK